MKKTLCILAALGVFLSLCGCSLPPGLAPTPAPEISEEPQTFGTLPDAEASQAVPDSAVSGPLTDADPEHWARGQLPEDLQADYDLLDAAAAARSDEPVSVSADMDGLQLALTALRIDHPEYFWFSGEADFAVQSHALSPEERTCILRYTMDDAAVADRQAQVDAYCEACLSDPEVQAAGTDYEKILAVYRYIIRTTDYDIYDTDQSILGVMLRHNGVCAGYARTFQYLMHRMDIPCVLMLGLDKSGENHSWNAVFCQGAWYQMDVTWGDPTNPDGSPGNMLSYTYCMVTDEEILRDHTLTGEIPMPECTETAYNYYRQAGLYLDTWDSLRYESLMRAALDAGETWLTVRFADEENYRQAVGDLIDGSGIFTVLKNCGARLPDNGVSYTVSDLFFEIAVRLAGQEE